MSPNYSDYVSADLQITIGYRFLARLLFLNGPLVRCLAPYNYLYQPLAMHSEWPLQLAGR